MYFDNPDLVVEVEDDEDERTPIERDEDYWTCLFPGNCCMPSPTHTRDECYTPEMAEEYFREEFADKDS